MLTDGDFGWIADDFGWDDIFVCLNRWWIVWTDDDFERTDDNVVWVDGFL
jgi:hypothetical protein